MLPVGRASGLSLYHQNRMRALLAGLVLFSACAAAQDCANVAALLDSHELRRRAWGAYLAGICAQHERGPELAFELEQMLPDRGGWPNSPEYWFIQTLLDALIQLHDPLPSATALPV